MGFIADQPETISDIWIDDRSGKLRGILNLQAAADTRPAPRSKSIRAQVCMNLLRKIEAEAERIAVSKDTAAQRIRNLIGTNPLP